MGTTVQATDHEASPGPAADLTEWSDLLLAQAWLVSGIRLRRLQHRPRPTVVVARLVRERARYHAEIQRRCPEGVAAWLAATPRARPVLGGSR